MTIEKTVLVPLERRRDVRVVDRARAPAALAARLGADGPAGRRRLPLDRRAGRQRRGPSSRSSRASGSSTRGVGTGGRGRAGRTSTITITLEPAEGGTTVRLVHEGLTPEQDEAHSHGWDHFMGRLVAAGDATGDAGLDPMRQRAGGGLGPAQRRPRRRWRCASTCWRRLAPATGRRRRRAPSTTWTSWPSISAARSSRWVGASACRRRPTWTHARGARGRPGSAGARGVAPARARGRGDARAGARSRRRRHAGSCRWSSWCTHGTSRRRPAARCRPTTGSRPTCSASRTA